MPSFSLFWHVVVGCMLVTFVTHRQEIILIMACSPILFVHVIKKL